MVKETLFMIFVLTVVACKEVNATVAVIVILDTHKSIVEVILQTMRSLIIP